MIKDKLIKLYNWFDIKQFIKFIKGRILIRIWTISTGLIMIDLLYFHYWQHVLIFTPVNTLLTYFIYRKVYKNE